MYVCVQWYWDKREGETAREGEKRIEREGTLKGGGGRG